MTVEHKDIPEAGLHEPKGVSTATSKQVYAADGAGSGVWEDPEIVGQGAATSGDLAFSTGAGGVTWEAGRVGGSTILAAPDFTNQLPSAVDTPLQVTFGGAQTVTELDLDAAGNLTCLVAGWYTFLWNIRFTRTSGTGVAHLLFRVLINGTQVGNSISSNLASASDVIPFSVSAGLDLAVNDVITAEILRDSAGNDDGGLANFVPVLGTWVGSPSADLRIDKTVVVV